MSQDIVASQEIVVLSGNPRAASRTAKAGQALAAAVQQIAPGEVRTIELAELAGELLAPAHPAVDEALETVRTARVLIVASPVYKASYTGLLKVFLDNFAANELTSLVALPLIVSGNPAHSLVGEVHLRPVLSELGAVLPTQALAITESQLQDLDAAFAPWLARWTPALTALLAS